MFKVLCPYKVKSNYVKGSDICHLSWTSRGVLLTGRNKTQIRVNEIVNALKTMDNHFGKRKFRSGNIPFTMFGPFDQKTNVLFKDSTDGLKTKYEFTKISNFERNLEGHLDSVLDKTQYCNSSNNLNPSKLFVYSLFTLLMIVKISW